MAVLNAVFVFLLVCGAEALHDWSAPPVELSPEDLGVGDLFGYSVAISGDIAVVGTGYADVSGMLNAGSVYVYVWNSGSWNHAFTRHGHKAGHYFGQDVAIDGTLLVVGAKHTDVNGPSDGAVYVYEVTPTTMTNIKNLTAIAPTNHSEFGYSVGVSDNVVVVGEYVTNGRAYVFIKEANNQWSSSELVPTTDDGHAYFGISIACSNDTILVRADDCLGSRTESCVFLFGLNSTGSWVETARIIDPAGELDESHSFGYALAISGDWAVVGDPNYDNETVVDPGAAYVYVREDGVWNTNGTLLPSPDPIAGDRFGWSVAVDGELILVGAPVKEDAGLSGAGIAYIGVYELVESVWQETRLTGYLSQASANFGYSVSVSGTRAIVGAPYTLPADTGEAYVFDATHAPSPDNDGLSTGAIIGIAVGAAVFASMLVLFVVMRRRKAQSYTSVATVGDAVRQLLPPSH